MSIKPKNLLLIIFFQFLYFHSSSQVSKYEKDQLQDSLTSRKYETLISDFYNSLNDTIKSKLYASAFLSKAKKENSQIHISKGYHLYIYLNNGKEKILKYCDSLIKIASNNNYYKYSTISYLEKGNYYYQSKDFKSALNNYLEANDHAKLYKGELKLELIIDYNIGLIKSRLGKNGEALDIFRRHWELKKNDSNIEEVLESLYSLADSYMKNGEYDSSSFYNSLGIKKASIYKMSEQYNKFILNEGIVQFKEGNYSKSLDSLNKVLGFFGRKHMDNELIEVYYYLGENFRKQNNIKEAVLNFKRVDSIFLKSKDIIPEARKAYEVLINYYKSKKDNRNQLFYIERLLKADSLLNTNYKYLNNKIISDYDTPILITKKQQIIDELNKEKRIYYFGISFLLIAVFTISFLFFNYRKREKINRERFKELISEKQARAFKIEKPSTDIGISVHVVQDILEKLEDFTKKEKYLSNDLTIQSLSKSFGTNPRYLSKVINYYKKKNFSNYVNDLRVEYAVKKMKEDKKFRNYTINAIALEIGFNSTQSFSNAFHKKYGIYPSYFIKQLEKEGNFE